MRRAVVLRRAVVRPFDARLEEPDALLRVVFRRAVDRVPPERELDRVVPHRVSLERLDVVLRLRVVLVRLRVVLVRLRVVVPAACA